eukprot:7391847-Prymnesium_polylepis.11
MEREDLNRSAMELLTRRRPSPGAAVHKSCDITMSVRTYIVSFLAAVPCLGYGRCRPSPAAGCQPLTIAASCQVHPGWQLLTLLASLWRERRSSRRRPG